MKNSKELPAKFTFSPAVRTFLVMERSKIQAAQNQFMATVSGVLASHSLLGADWELAADCSSVVRRVDPTSQTVPVPLPSLKKPTLPIKKANGADPAPALPGQ